MTLVILHLIEYQGDDLLLRLAPMRQLSRQLELAEPVLKTDLDTLAHAATVRCVHSFVHTLIRISKRPKGRITDIFMSIQINFMAFLRRGMYFVAITLAVGLAGCGGGGNGAEPQAPTDPRETSVTAASSLRWAAAGADGISITAITPATDGGLWVAGAEGGLEGRPFLRKVGGAASNPCGGDGLRFLSEIASRFERRQGITAMTSVRDGAFYLSFQGPGRVYVARFVESTCAIDASFGDQGVMGVPVPGLLTAIGLLIERDRQDSVLVATAFPGLVHLRRLNGQGQWDQAFGQQGLATNPSADSFWLARVATTANGDILISGSVSIPFAFAPALLKFSAAGAVITSFGSEGVQRYPEFSLGTAGAGAMVVEADRIVFNANTAGSVVVDDIVTYDSVIAAADLSTGRLQPGFGTGGFLRWDWGYNNSNMVGPMVPNRRGGFTACGHVIKSFVAGQPAALVDVTASGQADASVPYQGRRLIAQTDSAQCAGLVRMPDGRLAAAINDGGQAVVVLFDR